MRSMVVAIALAVLAAGCGGSSQTEWGTFQSRVLDGEDRFEEGLGFEDPTLLSFLEEERTWAQGITAEACYDPALRAYRDLIDEMVAAYAVNPSALPISELSLEQLTTARDALERAIAQYDRLNAAMARASTACQ